ncbi:MAG: Lrp/AsnC family transcriptional regulator [Candidatus Altiarchaeales archaeon]|nr:Lrp/AsnC family transcriptional regulator [Candidatus Altiarchaeales archaeon]
MAKVDELDLRIIREFQIDARQSYRDIAEKLKIAEGTVYNRVNKLKEMGIIKKFIVDINYSKLGYDLVAIIGIRGKGGHLPEIEEKVSKEKNVTTVYDVTGEYDAIAVAKFHDRTELNDLVKRINALPNVERTNTMIALNIVKEEHGVELR